MLTSLRRVVTARCTDTLEGFTIGPHLPERPCWRFRCISLDVAGLARPDEQSSVSVYSSLDIATAMPFLARIFFSILGRFQRPMPPSPQVLQDRLAVSLAAYDVLHLDGNGSYGYQQALKRTHTRHPRPHRQRSAELDQF